jgi:sugar diacid utilization regulator
VPELLQTERRALAEIISTVASAHRLEEVLAAVVRLLSDASAVHACFVYLVDPEGERLVLRAASPPYAHLVGTIELRRGEGLAWWALERGEPGLIRDNALLDPRNKYVPELEEETFQSLLSVPILGRWGVPSGAITLHTEAPREFTEDEVEFLVSAAALVSGAIDNARLAQESRRRTRDLELLGGLAEAVAGAETVEELLPAVVSRSRELLGARACHLYLLHGGDSLRLRASAPVGAAARPTIGLAELDLAGRTTSVAAPLVAGEELVGLLLAEGTGETELARAVATQTALAVKKIEAIERLTEKHAVRDFLEALAAGTDAPALTARAARLGVDLDQPHVVLATAGAEQRVERALRAAVAVAALDRRPDGLVALVRTSRGEEAVVADLRRVATELEIAAGVSRRCRGAASFAAGFEEAAQALRAQRSLRPGPGLAVYDELGPYAYLLRLPLDRPLRERHLEQVSALAAYDRERQTALVRTLEEFLARRGNISATADALYVHPNTLRQRLRRIAELSGLDLRRDDWLTLEIALKVERLRMSGPPQAT